MQTRELANFVCQIDEKNTSDATRLVIRQTVLDTIGAAIAGSATAEGDIWSRYFLAYHSDEPAATVLGKALPAAGYRHAAAVNAAFGHILDFDDVCNLAIAHLGVVTVPGALAVAQSRNASGKELMSAVAAGFEIGARIGYAINPSAYKIWHTTSVVGGLSTCAAVGRLLHLSPEQMLHAFGSAGTQAAGLWEFMADGAMSKPLHTANATLCGIRSAELAALGLTGASRILEGSQGLLRAMSKEYHPERLTQDFGSEYLISKNAFKPYPCCRHIHSAMYSMIKLLQKHHLSPNQIAQIRSYTYDTAQNLTDRPEPATAYACKFSMQYCLSAIALRGGYDIAIFDDASMQDASIRAFMKKIRVISDEDINSKIAQDAAYWGNRLEVEYADGTVFTEATDYPPGDPNAPMTWQSSLEKFHSLADPVIGREYADYISRKIEHLEQVDNVNDIFPI